MFCLLKKRQVLYISSWIDEPFFIGVGVDDIVCFMLFQVKFVNPLLRSPVVGEVAYETMVQLSKCSATPLCNWALEIATALRVIATEDINAVWDLIPPVGEGEPSERPSLSLFERVRNALSLSCKSGPLPVDSFTFVFPVSFLLIYLPFCLGFQIFFLFILWLFSFSFSLAAIVHVNALVLL